MKKNNELQFYALLLAAGKGSRLEYNSRVKKQFITYQDTPLWWQSIKRFYASPYIKGVVLVFPNDDKEFLEACEEATRLHAQHNIGIPFIYARGGEKRHNSVFSGLEALPSTCTHVLVHDSARPFFSTHLIHTLVSPFKNSQNIDLHAVIPAIAVTDTIKIIQDTNTIQDINKLEYRAVENNADNIHKNISANNITDAIHDTRISTAYESCTNEQICEQVKETLERQALRAVQTPQAFSVHELIAAHKKMHTQYADSTKQPHQLREITDDAMLMENIGHVVYVVPGEISNVKITHAKDLNLLQNKTQQIPCSGYGYDVHRFGGDRPFILGGITIPTNLQVEAHSDGDVLLHALMDALLSCMCLGDIGTYFPDSDPKYHNISSSLLLDHVMDLWKESSLLLCHVDLTIITQKPQINPFAKEIKKNIARLLSTSLSFVNIKATTEEKLGFTGKGLGIKAVALVSALKTIEV